MYSLLFTQCVHKRWRKGLNVLKRIPGTLRANPQKRHGQLRSPSAPLLQRSSPAQQGRQVRLRAMQWCSWPCSQAHCATAAICAGPFRMALGACVSLPTTARPWPSPWVSGCLLTNSSRWLCSPSGPLSSYMCLPFSPVPEPGCTLDWLLHNLGLQVANYFC